MFLARLEGCGVVLILIAFLWDFACSDFYTELIFPELITECPCLAWHFLIHKSSSHVFLACLSCFETESPRAHDVLELGIIEDDFGLLLLLLPPPKCSDALSPAGGTVWEASAISKQGRALQEDVHHWGQTEFL